MESAEEGEPEGEEDLPTEEEANSPPEQEADDRVTTKEEASPSPERESSGPSRAAPRRDPVGPKRMAPPPPDANAPKRPAHAPVHRPEPDAEEP
eukprot:4999571-Amphidinium_carterae.1